MPNISINTYILYWLLFSSLLFVIPALGIDGHAASYYSNLLQIIAALLNTGLCLRTASLFGRKDLMRLVWVFMGAGIFSWGMGEILYTGYILSHNGNETPYPWFSDIGFLLIQPLMVFALFLFSKTMAVRPPVWGIVVSLGLLAVTLWMSFNAASGNLAKAENGAAYLAILAYAIFDPVLLATTVLSASLLGGGMLARPWWFCFGGITLYYVSNRVFEIQTAQGTYVSGSWVDLGWPLAFILIGVAAMLYHDMLREDD